MFGLPQETIVQLAAMLFGGISVYTAIRATLDTHGIRLIAIEKSLEAVSNALLKLAQHEVRLDAVQSDLAAVKVEVNLLMRDRADA